MLTTDGWFDWATRKPGIPDKKYAQGNSPVRYLPHSAVGYIAGAEARLFSTERDQTTGRYTDYAAASWHLWIPYSGMPSSVIQYYSVFDALWASGSRQINTSSVAAENEGGPPGNENETFTTFQTEMNARAIADLVNAGFMPPNPRRPVDSWQATHTLENLLLIGNQVYDLDAQLYEHRECVRFGSAPTACPSWRINWEAIQQQVTIMTNPDSGGSAGMDGWHKEGHFWKLYQDGVNVLRVGSEDGAFPGRISKLFGIEWLWLRGDWEHGSAIGFPAIWSRTEGD